MKVAVHVSSILHEYTGGKSQLEAKGQTVGQVLNDLEKRHRGLLFRIVDEQDAIRQHIKVYVGGNQVRGLEAKVPPGSEIHILQALSGG